MEMVIDVVIPVFAVVLTGYGAGRAGLLGPSSSEALNLFVYYGALPALLFVTMARVPSEQIFNLPFFGAYGGGLLIVALIAWPISRFGHGHDLATGTMYGFCSLFANTGYMGIPLAMVAFGPEGVLPAALASVINAVVVGVVAATLEVARGGHSGMRALVPALRALAFNPMVVGPVLGILYSVSGLPLPKALANYCDILGAAAGPGALFALGLFLVGQKLDGRAELAGIVILKLLVQPLATWGLMLTLFPMDTLWTQVTILMAATPIGATAFVIGQRYGVYVQRASAAIMISTVLSVISVGLVLVWFS